MQDTNNCINNIHEMYVDVIVNYKKMSPKRYDLKNIFLRCLALSSGGMSSSSSTGPSLEFSERSAPAWRTKE
jgi:hypothetical protein